MLGGAFEQEETGGGGKGGGEGRFFNRLRSYICTDLLYAWC